MPAPPADTRRPSILLNAGLFTAVSPAFMPEGALSDATNMTYRAGDGALLPAKGRKRCAAGGHAAEWAVPLEWDVELPATNQPTELLFKRASELRTIPASSTNDDPRMAGAVADLIGG